MKINVTFSESNTGLSVDFGNNSGNGGAGINDSVISTESTWSSKNTVDKLCPAFTESGSAVTCEPIEGYPLEVVSYINPIQEGSGEPSPGGVNLIAGVAYKTASNWSMDVVDGKDAYVYKLGEKFTSGQYCFSGNSGYNVHLVHYNEYAGERSTLVSGQGTFKEVCQAEFYEDWDYNRLLLAFYKEDVASLQDALDVLESLKLEHGSGGNIRPIRGQTSVNLSHGGKNLFDDVAFYKANGFEKQADGTWLGKYLNVVIYENIDGNDKQITISATGKRTDISKNTVCFYVQYTDGTSQYLTPFVTNTGITTDIVRTNASKIVSKISWSHGNQGTYYIKDVQLEYGAVASDYNAYIESVPIVTEFGQTVYSGTYNFVTGELIIDKTAITLEGSFDWREYEETKSKACSVFTTTIDNAKTDGHAKKGGFSTSVCSHFNNTNNSNPYNVSKVKVGTYTDHLYLTNIYINWGTDDATVADFTSWLDEQKLSGTPVQLLYTLADPITIQLTPHEIIGFKGTNILSVDANSISVTGRKDPVAIIDKLTKAILSLGGNV